MLAAPLVLGPLMSVAAAPGSVAGAAVLPRVAHNTHQRPGAQPRSLSTFVTMSPAVAPVKIHGAAWDLVVTASQLLGKVDVSLERVVSSPLGAEFHDWTLNMGASALNFSSSTGKGSLDPGSATSPIATIKLAFKAVSHKAESCTSGSETEYLGTVSGELILNSGLASAGKVGGTTVTFLTKSPQPTMVVDSDCTAATDGCLASVIYSSQTLPAVSGAAESLAGKTYNAIGITKPTSLSSPAGASRDDGAFVVAGASLKNKVLTIKAPSTGVLTGSGTISGGTQETEKVPCAYGGKKYTLTYVINEAATYTPGTSPLTAHMTLTPKLVPAKSTKATYAVITVAAA